MSTTVQSGGWGDQELVTKDMVYPNKTHETEVQLDLEGRPLPPVNLQAFDEETLQGRPRYTRELLEAGRRIVASSREEWRLDHLPSITLARYPEKGPVDRLKLAERPWTQKDLRHTITDFKAAEKHAKEVLELWESSPACTDFKKLLQECAKEMPRIDKVITFGLGTFSYTKSNLRKTQQRWMREHYRTTRNSLVQQWAAIIGFASKRFSWKKYHVIPDRGARRMCRSSLMQHCTAMTIASALDDFYAQQGLGVPPVRILVQDPHYTNSDIAILRSMNPNIECLEDPDGFLAIDEATFVVFSHCVAPVYEIMADLAVSSGGQGVGAVLGDRIRPGKERPPRVLRFLEKYEKRDFDDFAVPAKWYEEVGGWKAATHSWHLCLWDMEMRYKKG